MTMPRRSINEAPPAPEQLRAMENLLAPSEELAGLVDCILDWDFKSGPFIGAHLVFEWGNWGDGVEIFSLSLERLAAQNATAWRDVRIRKAFSWGGELPFTSNVLFRRGGNYLDRGPSPHPKDRLISQASFAGVFDALSAVRASIPEGAFTKTPKP